MVLLFRQSHRYIQFVSVLNVRIFVLLDGRVFSLFTIVFIFQVWSWFRKRITYSATQPKIISDRNRRLSKISRHTTGIYTVWFACRHRNTIEPCLIHMLCIFTETVKQKHLRSKYSSVRRALLIKIYSFFLFMLRIGKAPSFGSNYIKFMVECNLNSVHTLLCLRFRRRF